MDYKDYYKTLGVPKDASADEIKKSYRKLARRYHPDINQDAGAEDKVKEVNEAYEVLKDKKKRAAYDQMGADWQHGGASNWAGGRGSQGFGGADFSDFFESVFQQQQGAGFGQQRQHRERPKGEDQSLTLDITLEEAFNGGEKVIRLPVKNTTSQYATPEFKKLKVAIPKGTISGNKIRLSGQGHASSHGGKAGDLILELQVKRHSLFEVNDQDLTLRLNLTPWEAALGTKVKIPTMVGEVDLKIAKNAKSGQKLRLKGRGLPGKSVGDQYVEIMIQNPVVESEEEIVFYTQMQNKFAFNPRQF
ncbi:MAG: DnaJ domain-containing protein [Gammaproteobacteria bacterium]|nr:DnaJ domain-containing protein [Gammaproteobacteria bacterium]